MKASLYDQLTSISESIGFLLPEIILAGAIVILILLSIFRKASAARCYGVALISFLLALGLLWDGYDMAPVSLLNGALQVSDFATAFRLLVCVGAILTVVLTDWKSQSMEYYLLVISVVLGANLLLMTSNLIVVTLCMEIISISSYVLTAGQHQDKIRSEASWKFFLFGSASTAVMIFGMTYLYGATGTLDFANKDFVFHITEKNFSMFAIGGVMAAVGFLFKMTAAPFHWWAPDVYESVPTPVAAFFSVVPKLASLGLMVRFSLAMNLFGNSVVDWSLVIGTLALFSIIVGTLAALSQKNAKRMMAYSSVAQAGFLLAGVSSFSLEGVHVTLFYAAVFLVTNFTVFQAIREGEKQFGSSEMAAFAGWGRRSFLLPVCLSAGLISLAGLPPTAGFMSKLFLFSAVWEKYQASGNGFFLILFALGLLTVVISLFFYFRLPYFLFIKTSATDNSFQKINTFNNLLALILVTVLLLLFFSPGLLMGWANKVNFVL